MKGKTPTQIILFFLCVSASLRFVSGCNRAPHTAANEGNRVVLYCSVDEVYAKPILKRIERETGLKIDAIFDVEAAKTAGLANRIMAEGDHPRADVFWSSALLQTLLLARKGMVQPYISEQTRAVPPSFRSPGGIWTGTGARAHVIIYNKSLTGAPPRQLSDLLDARFKGRVGFSNPQFGSASDATTALCLRRGTKSVIDVFKKLKAQGAQVLPGNSVVAERVASGELLAGITDTDDFMAQHRKTDAILLAPPGPLFISTVREQKISETVLVPMSAAVIANALHPNNARKLLNALVSRATEDQLVRVMPGVLPIRGPLPKDQAILKPYSALALSPDVPDDSSRWPMVWDDLRDLLANALL